jgi:hypothetical protein
MIAEKERDEALTTLAQTQNEELFRQVLELLRSQQPSEPPRQRLAPPGFARQEGFWMADDFDEPLADFADYQ